ncbi:unnamed protein product [Closterium sp. Yama58-4]|nr:unnamed protein product [Closterium sp. Yama58-4]
MADPGASSIPTPSTNDSTAAQVVDVEASHPKLKRIKTSSSKIWLIFTKLECGKKAKCNYCTLKPAIYALTGSSTSSMRIHAMKSHPKEFRLLVGGAEQTDAEDGSSNEISRALLKIKAFSDKENREKLVRIFAKGLIPFSFIEDEDFRTYLHWLNPRASMPSRVTLANDIHAAYNACVGKIKNLLLNLSCKVSFTHDTWSSPTNASYIAITCHWIDDDFNNKSILLDFKHFECHHTGEAIKDTFVKCVYEDWELGEMVMAITVDNASNNKRFIDLLGVEKGFPAERHMRCFNHVIHLVVEVILKHPPIEDALKKIRAFATHLKGSTLRKGKFWVRCKEKGLHNISSLAHDTPTHWGSAHFLMKIARMLRPAINAYLVEDVDDEVEREFQMRSEEWDCLERLENLLAPFAEIQDMLEGSSYPTLSLCVPSINALMDILEGRVEEKGEFWEACKEGLEKLKGYYDRT